MVPIPPPSVPRMPIASQQHREVSVRICNRIGKWSSWGSGTVVQTDDGRRVIMSCWHLFREGLGELSVYTSGGQKYKAKLLGTDKTFDLSVMTAGLPKSHKAAKMAETDPYPGTKIVSCGYGPVGRFRCLTGVLGGYVLSSNTERYNDMVYTGAARGGDSGGGAFNEKGRFCGVIWGSDEKWTQTTRTTCLKRIRLFLRKVLGRIIGRRGGAKPAPSNPAPPVVLGPPVEYESTPDLVNPQIAANAKGIASIADKQQASSKEQAGLLAGLKDRIGELKGSQTKPADWIAPLVYTALAGTAPPTLAVIAWKLGTGVLRRRRRKKGETAEEEPYKYHEDKEPKQESEPYQYQERPTKPFVVDRLRTENQYVTTPAEETEGNAFRMAIKQLTESNPRVKGVCKTLEEMAKAHYEGKKISIKNGLAWQDAPGYQESLS